MPARVILLVTIALALACGALALTAGTLGAPKTVCAAPGGVIAPAEDCRGFVRDGYATQERADAPRVLRDDVAPLWAYAAGAVLVIGGVAAWAVRRPRS